MNDIGKFPIRDDIDVPPESLEAWQRLLDLMAEVFHVPAALIMRVHAKEIEVFLRSKNPDNVYERGEISPLNSGLYCEMVMRSRQTLLVPDATRDPTWDHNPDLKLGMIAYLGVPLIWPTGHIFGTMCVLDRKENRFSETYVRLLEQLKNVVEHDLRLIDAESRLRASEVRYRTMFNAVLDGIVVSHLNGSIVDANEVARSQLGFDAGDLLRLRVPEVFHTSCDWASEVVPRVSSGEVFRCEGEQIRSDGTRTPVDIQFVRMVVGGESKVFTVAHDITERKKLEQELHRMAFTDPLTGIGNRGGFERALRHELEQAARYDRSLSIALLDLDHFKLVNDRFGHEAGDLVLSYLCKIALTHLRHADLFFRYGGEEFVALMPETTLDGALHVAERMRSSVAESPVETIGVVTVSIGVAQYHRGETRHQLVNRVDSALYAAKAAGRNAVSAG